MMEVDWPSLSLGHVGMFHLHRSHPQWIGTCTSNPLGDFSCKRRSSFVNGVDESFIRVRVMDLDITGDLGVWNLLSKESIFSKFGLKSS